MSKVKFCLAIDNWRFSSFHAGDCCSRCLSRQSTVIFLRCSSSRGLGSDHPSSWRHFLSSFSFLLRMADDLRWLLGTLLPLRMACSGSHHHLRLFIATLPFRLCSRHPPSEHRRKSLTELRRENCHSNGTPTNNFSAESRRFTHR